MKNTFAEVEIISPDDNSVRCVVTMVPDDGQEASVLSCALDQIDALAAVGRQRLIARIKARQEVSDV